jgi:glycerol-3-phosphate cytidylyltransferase-like family protein
MKKRRSNPQVYEVNRQLRRAITRHNDEVDRFILRKTIKVLERLNIDYTVIGDEIVTPRKKEVQDIYDNTRLNALTCFSRCGGSIAKFKQLYNSIYG